MKEPLKFRGFHDQLHLPTTYTILEGVNHLLVLSGPTWLEYLSRHYIVNTGITIGRLTVEILLDEGLNGSKEINRTPGVAGRQSPSS